MTLSLDILAIIFAVAQLGLVLFVLLRMRHQEDKERIYWLLMTIFVTGLTTIVIALSSRLLLTAPLTISFFVWSGLMAATVCYGGLVLHDIGQHKPLRYFPRHYALISAVWVTAYVALALIQERPVLGWVDWTQSQISAGAALALAGMGLYGLLLLGVTFYSFYKAPMPEVANRFAFWSVITAVFMIGVVLTASGSFAVVQAGILILFMATAGMVYGCYFYRLLDVRTSILMAVRIVLIVLITWSFVFSGVYFVNRTPLPANLTTTLLLAVLALFIAVLSIPTRQLIDALFGQIALRSRPNLAAATAEYSKSVARAASLEEVVGATTETLNRVMGVKRSALILINNTFRVPNSVELLVMEGGSSFTRPAGTGYLSKNSPIYKTLALMKVPLAQFDIEYGDAYRHLASDEKGFFRRIMLRAYAPIISENTLIGILACGPKLNDTPFFREDMELLVVLGQQVGTALRSARLIDDLQHLNNSMRALNRRLEDAKIELEKLDSVKTDFITIASHELRTPLAQIRGYTDILDSLNEQGLLQPGQITQMIGSLRKSTERMEDLISNMLDVSQLDVNAMDLRFVRTTIDTIIRLALEPLKEALEQRQLTVDRDGLNGLPHIQVDMQRMVQAFRNIIQNAIKFTPDGGRITIVAQHEPAASENEIPQVVVTVKDTGVGIAQKDLELIFQKFYRGFDTQLHSSGAFKFLGAGPGLGLTIARGIVEGHGGTIWAESPGHDIEKFPGSTFHVRIPVHPPQGTRRVMPFESDEMPAVSRNTSEVRRVELEASDTRSNNPVGSAD